MKLSPNPKVTFQPVDPVKKARLQPIVPVARGIELTIRPSEGRPTIDGNGSHKPEFSQLSLSLSDTKFQSWMPPVGFGPPCRGGSPIVSLNNMAWKPM